MPGELKAVLLDYDGTLVDTEPVWCLVEQEMMRERGDAFTPEEHAAMRGQSAWLTIEAMRRAFDASVTPQQIHDELHARVADYIRSHDPPFLPGARELLTELDEKNVPCAIVTASNRLVIDASVDRLPSNVSFIITSDDVTELKPHPEGYLSAMSLLGVTPGEVVILEDSMPGVTAALATGAVVLGMLPNLPLPPDPRLHVTPDGLNGVTFDYLRDVWRARKENS